uniref:DUF2723 domain-containing protein n=1 Tax=Roseihalotalea indica TaxID=2867963 RepID=A0AA49JHZ4_9BACT|nr:DUF2723 domain-containing protein [Tunicatimonas sp. TK19036]
MQTFTRINNLSGWAVGAIATLTYWLTVEPTASFWDCGEFIATAYTLGVPHPPGAPLYLLIARLFAYLSFGDAQQVAYWINVLSVLCSGLTITFTFWTITLLGRKLMNVSSGKESVEQIIGLVGSGAVGALVLAFSDTFWFSATEAEVYAMASLLAAIGVWAILRWEAAFDTNPGQASRWLILLAYLLGLSVGVHILSLLIIPSVVLVYYFKRESSPTTIKTGVALAVGAGVLLLVTFGLGGLTTLAAKLDIFLVNQLGMPFGSGVVMSITLLVLGLGYGLYQSARKQQVNRHTAWLAFTFLWIGYLSYALIPIRAEEEPGINLNNPNHVVRLLAYLNREQYPSRPLLYGPYFTAELQKQEAGDKIYERGDDNYYLKDRRIEQVYDEKAQTILPRMGSMDASHADLYRQWTGLRPDEKPTFADNLTFLVRYQLGHMYLRYFLWNFAGRESDRQGGGWLAPWADWQKLPSIIAENAARNQYWMLPLLLGVAGMIFQYRKHRSGFWVMLSLFLMTGVALVLYSNNPPIEPRERDYVFAPNFYAFSLWVGLGFLGVAMWVRHQLTLPRVRLAIPFVLLMIPVWMGVQNWDDHNRSDRYFSVDAARNMLASCDENAILFTGGDNDTYPLWYVQNVEGFRTDVRVLVTSFANVDWYIEQMKRPLYQSEELPLSLSMKEYQQGGPNDYIPYVENPRIKGAIDAYQYLQLIKKGSPALQMKTTLGSLNTLPARALYFREDTTAHQTFIPEQFQTYKADQLRLSLKGNGLEKKDLLILDLIDSGKWTRPVYFNSSSQQSVNFDLAPHLIQEGDTFRLVPLDNPQPDQMLVDTDKMYQRLMHDFAYRGLNDPHAYYHGYYLMYAFNYRMNFNKLAQALIAEAKPEKARQALGKILEVIPDEAIPYDVGSIQSVPMLLALEEKEKADHIADTVTHRYDELLTYLNEHADPQYAREQSIGLFAFSTLADAYYEFGYPEKAEEYQQLLQKHYRAG